MTWRWCSSRYLSRIRRADWPTACEPGSGSPADAGGGKTPAAGKFRGMEAYGATVQQELSTLMSEGREGMQCTTGQAMYELLFAVCAQCRGFGRDGALLETLHAWRARKR